MAKMLEFYDVGQRERFTTSKYDIKTKTVNGKKRKYAVADSKKGNYKVWRVLPKD